ncbi:TPA: phage tail fiber protein, partial [Acinetobacter baumannii]
MAVPEQTPFIEYTANGTTTVFPLPFQCDKSDYLIVNLDGNEAPVGSWSFVNDNVTFNTAPANGVLIEIKRNTPFQRTTEYQSYNNSFRPSPVNKDFDLIWWKLQELGLADWFLNKKLEKEIQDRINADLQLQSEIDQVAHDLFHEIIDRKNADAEVVAYLKAYIQEVMLSAIDIGSINALAITTVDSISALSPLLKWEGRTVFVKSYHSP